MSSSKEKLKRVGVCAHTAGPSAATAEQVSTAPSHATLARTTANSAMWDTIERLEQEPMHNFRLARPVVGLVSFWLRDKGYARGGYPKIRSST